MRRWNDMLDHVVPRIDPLATSSGSGSEKSYIRTVWDAAGKGVSFFSLSGKRINSSGRTAAIMDLMTPHLHKALARVVCGDKSEATSCSVLSPREKAVIDWLRKGKSNPDIAAIMDISERTVKFHISNIMQKLDASSRTHAVAIAIEQGLLDSR